RRIEARPVDPLVLVANPPREIESPVSAIVLNGQISERNDDLRRPAVGNAADPGLPQRIPLGELHRVVELELVGAAAGCSHFEAVSIVPGLPGIELDYKRIGSVERPIALHGAGN